MSNPIESIAAWMSGVGHGAEQVKLYESLVMEEFGEVLLEYVVTDGAGTGGAQSQIAQNMIDASKVLRTADELRLVILDHARLLDAHLDSVWVHLCAANALLGGDAARLSAAWAELHRSNIVDKQVDGKFITDASGKVVKPSTWTAPNFEQFFPDFATI